MPAGRDRNSPPARKISLLPAKGDKRGLSQYFKEPLFFQRVDEDCPGAPPPRKRIMPLTLSDTERGSLGNAPEPGSRTKIIENAETKLVPA